MDDKKEESKPFSWTREDLQGLESFLSANRFAKYLRKTSGNCEKAENGIWRGINSGFRNFEIHRVYWELS
ncbi:MAG: hypothetical protein OXF29_07475 [Hyphomicrobiales bacterium]|nr:hypothetical protein [Hyphomicrobiales bacterium]